jgi:hypothetical protein
VDECRYSKSEPQNCDGILVINPFRETDPENRSGYIDSNAERFMDDRDHKVLTTPSLYQMYTEYMKKKVSTDQIKELLTGDEIVIDMGSIS